MPIRHPSVAERLRLWRASIRYAANEWDARADVPLAPQGFSRVMLATGRAFDVLDVPSYLGRNLVTGAPLGPVALTPAGRWLMFVRAGAVLRPALAALPGVRLHGTGSAVPAPPSRLVGGRVRWLVPPWDVDWRVPDPVRVQARLVRPGPGATGPVARRRLA